MYSEDRNEGWAGRLRPHLTPFDRRQFRNLSSRPQAFPVTLSTLTKPLRHEVCALDRSFPPARRLLLWQVPACRRNSSRQSPITCRRMVERTVHVPLSLLAHVVLAVVRKLAAAPRRGGRVLRERQTIERQGVLDLRERKGDEHRPRTLGRVRDESRRGNQGGQRRMRTRREGVLSACQSDRADVGRVGCHTSFIAAPPESPRFAGLVIRVPVNDGRGTFPKMQGFSGLNMERMAKAGVLPLIVSGLAPSTEGGQTPGRLIIFNNILF